MKWNEIFLIIANRTEQNRSEQKRSKANNYFHCQTPWSLEEAKFQFLESGILVYLEAQGAI